MYDGIGITLIKLKIKINLIVDVAKCAKKFISLAKLVNKQHANYATIVQFKTQNEQFFCNVHKNQYIELTF